jgi:peptidyl-dipeptidase Dcp
MCRLTLLLTAAALALSTGTSAESAEPTEPAEPPPANPFFAPSPLPFEAPDFSKIKASDYEPAIEEGMRRQLEEVREITTRETAPTFENTIVALERSGQLLTRVAKVFFAVNHANTDDTLQAIQTRVAPRLSAHRDAIFLDARLYARIKAIHAQGDALGLDPVSRSLVERYERDFVHAGAALSQPDQQRLRDLNQELATLTTTFQQKLLAATKAGALVLDRAEELAGLPPADVAAAAQAAKARGLDGKWALTLQNTTQQPAQVYLKDRSVRQRLYEASIRRAEKGDANDTREIIRRLQVLRAQKAALMGTETFAAYKLGDQMARTPEVATKLLTDLVPAAMARARQEAARMQALVEQQGGRFQLEPWDWQFYANQVRKADYAIDDAQTRPYFELDRVLEDGVFFAARELYGLRFKERRDLPVYHPDVRVFDVFDADGEPLALFYADYWRRDNKAGGAWMDTFVDGSGLMGTKPVVFNACNYTKPAPGQPALLGFDEVTTLFHELGHALHGLLTTVKYPTLAGTNVPRDFVEFPSQIYEHWALHPRVLARYARHHETGAPMSADLVAKLRKTHTFNQGFATLEYLQAALLDMAWHSLPADAPPQDVASFEAAALERFGVAFELVPPRYRTPYFAHIWKGSYAAGYYSYMWSDVLAHDGFAWFEEQGGLTRANGQRFRDMILSRGHSEELSAMYRAFRGRDPDVKPLLEGRGLVGFGEAAE